MSMADRFIVGLALEQTKQRSFVQQTLIDLAMSKGVDLVSIDPRTPLVEQGPFDAILHKVKVGGEDWKKQLAVYEQRFPGVIIVDRPEAIERLHNRMSMLQAVAEVDLTVEGASVGIPEQCVAENEQELSSLRTTEGLKFPVIAKPLLVDGSVKSHAMFLVFNIPGLTKVKPPVVIQKFVNHGGVIFKVYVVGDHVKCVRRISLPDVEDIVQNSMQEPISFSQISNTPSTSDKSSGAIDEELSNAELPPQKFLSDIARGLRTALGMRLFNFDVIRDSRVGNQYYVIDINYFPGYSKMPVFESVFTEFFCELAREKAAARGIPSVQGA